MPIVFLIVVLVVLLAYAPPSAPEASLTARFWSVADTPIAITIVSTAIAAFFGTWGAQLLAERIAERKRLIAEIRGTNAAISFATDIANAYLGTKKQLVRDLVEKYKQRRTAWLSHVGNVKAGRTTGAPFKLEMELRTIWAPFSPIEELREALGNKISPDGRAMMLLTPLVQSIRGFANTMSEHNAWIREVKRMPADADLFRLHLYFGTPFSKGRTDDRYPNFVNAMNEQTDDCIAFSIMIAESLKQYGDRLAERCGRGAPKIAAPDFSKAGDLVPDMRNYSQWLSH